MILTLADVSVGGKGSYGIAASAVPYNENLHTYLRITDISDDGRLNCADLKSVDDPKAADYLLQPNDIVFARTGASTGRNYFYDGTDGEFVYAGFLIKFSLDPHKINPQYVKYYCQSKDYKDWINSFNTGSTRGNINAQTLAKMPIPFLEREKQDALVSILSVLDRKIANNEKINNNLEQQAKSIFKSWFVDFDPFGGEQPSDMQLIPLKDLCKVITKGTTPTTLGKPFTSSGINFIKAESILNNHSIDNGKFAYIDEETNMMLKRSIITANDIVFTIAGTLGRFALVDESILPANTNQAVAIIRPDTNKITPSYLYSFFIGNWHNDYYSKRVQQAVQANLSLTTIKSLPIPVMNENEMSKYNELVSPLFALMKSNEAENRTLAQIRDNLLPKLMSGELDVSEIDL